MRRSKFVLTVLASAAAVGGGLGAKRSLDNRVASWSTNPDTTDGDPMTMPEGTSIQVTADDGTTLRGLDAGDGPTVMLVHCWTGSVGFWAPVARRLVEAGFRVVAIDQRGHGRSDRGDAPYSCDTLADDLRVWVETLDLRGAVVAGHSMGGLAAMAFATRHTQLAHERVSGLVLVATLAAPVRDPRLPDVKVDLAKFLPLGDRLMRPTDYGLFGLLGVFGTRPARAQMEAARAGWYATDPTTRAEAATMMGEFDLRPALHTIEIPTQVVAGSHDQLTSLAMNEEIADHIAGSRLEVLPGLGHMLPWEAPDQVTDLIVQAAKPA